MNKRVVLPIEEIELCALAGIARQIENLKLNRKPAHGDESLNDWQIHIEGILGEMALSKFLGLPWNGKGIFRGPDVGDMDCRTAPRDDYALRLHPSDPDDRIFWLVCGKNGTYVIKGWTYARDGKRPELWGSPYAKNRPAFWVPQHELCSPESYFDLFGAFGKQPPEPDWPDVMGTG
jgi:hypothetical protein